MEPRLTSHNLTATLTFIIIADGRVPSLQVHVILPDLTFTALQSALCAYSCTNFFQVETENIMRISVSY